MLAVIYDALLREGWARRALQKDPELDIPREVAKIDEQTLLLARTRLEQVMPSSARNAAHSRAAISGDNMALRDQAESALAKSAAAAQALTRRAEQASRALSSQQDDLQRREKTMAQ